MIGWTKSGAVLVAVALFLWPLGPRKRTIPPPTAAPRRSWAR